MFIVFLEKSVFMALYMSVSAQIILLAFYSLKIGCLVSREVDVDFFTLLLDARLRESFQ